MNSIYTRIWKWTKLTNKGWLHQPLLCNLAILMVEVNPNIAILPWHLKIFVLIFFHVPFCFCPRRHSPNLRRHSPSPRSHGLSQRALTSPLKGTIGFIGWLLSKNALSPKRGCKIDFFLGICSMKPYRLPFVPPRAYQILG
jgi:hypothetical protein